MSLRISGKHMNVGQSLSAQARERIANAVEKYFHHGFSGSVTLEKTAKGIGFACDCTLHLDSGIVLQAAGRGSDPAAAFDEAAERIEKRLRRYKRRLKEHHHRSEPPGPPADSLAGGEGGESFPDGEGEADSSSLVIAESLNALPRESVAEAAIQLERDERPLIVFRNAASERINVVYRRPDGNIGWIDPQADELGANVSGAGASGAGASGAGKSDSNASGASASGTSASQARK